MASLSPEFRKDFLQAAFRGDMPSLQGLVAEAVFKMGEGPAKIACATLTTSEGSNALHLAALGGTRATCRFLVEELDFDINSTDHGGETPLLQAALGGHQPTIIYLIQNGADVSRSNYQGCTPLHCAAATARGSKEIVTLLISEGADIHAMSQKGTPLHAAAFGGNHTVVKYLLDLGADPNSISPLYKSPLMEAMLDESIECMELLLKAGANPNEVCSGAQVTPLCFAVNQQFDAEMIRYLLNAGADPNMTEHWGMTALEQAALIGRLEVVQLLFPVTSRIPCYPDWSINGIMNHVLSKEATELRESKMEELLLLTKARGKKAFERKDYVHGCDVLAIQGDPTDAKSLSNRCLCYTLLNEGKPALADAKACVKLEPGWAKAHYREGAAWKVLKNYKKAAEAFSRALELDPGKKEIEEAYSEALAERFTALTINH